MEIIRLADTPINKAVEKAVHVLRKGEVILYPTDTLYGLGVDARNPEAVARLKELKGRESKKPISVIVSDVKHMERCGVMNAAAHAIAERFLPGPLTLVLPAHPSMPKEVQLGDAIGLRIPNNDFCLALAKAYGEPITTTSANVSGLPTKRSVNDIIWHFGKEISRIALIIDAGELPESPPSTVVRVTDETPRLLRDGALAKELLGFRN
jgi:L-threonylcarbamoyladenylate synthase